MQMQNCEKKVWIVKYKQNCEKKSLNCKMQMQKNKKKAKLW